MKKITEALQKRDIEDLRVDLNKLIGAMNLGFDGIHKRQDATNNRISKLEAWRYFIMGGVAILAILLTPLLYVIFRK